MYSKVFTDAVVLRNKVFGQMLIFFRKLHSLLICKWQNGRVLKYKLKNNWRHALPTRYT